MKNYRKHIDDFFREKLGTYSETPPPEVWDDLGKRLDGLATTGTPGTPYRWLWHFAIVSVLLFLGVSVLRKATDSPKNTAIALKSASDPATGTTQTAANTNQATGSVPQGALVGNAPGNIQNTTNGPAASSNNNSNRRNSPAQRLATSNNQTSPNSNTGLPGSSPNSFNGQYAASSSKHGPSAEENNGNTQSSTANAQATASNSKQTGAQNANAATPKKQQPNAVDRKANKHNNIGFDRFEGGVKVGYEGGYTDGAASKAVIAPYVQYNMSRKFALMIQPAIKEANISNKNIGSPESYYAIDPETSTTTSNDNSSLLYHGATVDTIHKTTWTYTQRHDSVVKSNVFRGNYTELELPILLKYSVCRKISVYGGVNLVYSKLMGVTENTYVKSGIIKSMTTDTITTINGTPQPPKNAGITYSGTPYSSYKGPAYPGTPETQVRVGYMFGFSYAFSKKWLFDGLVEQAPATPDVKAGYNITTPLSSTYFRLSIGYKLTK